MLAVDIGNTFTRLAAFSGDTVRERRSFHTRDLDIIDLMGAFAEIAAPSEKNTVWISSVYPEANATMDSAAQRCGLPRRFIKPGQDHIFPHSLQTPQTTGSDRLLSALAAGIRHFPDNAAGQKYVTIQCGSAATIDLVDSAGAFIGGYILPGPSMWLRTLASAAQLPDLSTEPPDWTVSSPGNSTRTAIMNGMTTALPLAVAASARHLYGKRDSQPGSSPPPIIVTGGWGEAVAKLGGEDFVYDRDLLLHGIRLFAERSGNA